jgi:hypothetical protein
MKKKIVLFLLIVMTYVQIVGAITIPNPSFTMSLSKGYTPLVVQFRDTSSGSYNCIGWDFDDGFQKEGTPYSKSYLYGKRYDSDMANPTHTYYYYDMGGGFTDYPTEYHPKLYLGLSEGTTGTSCSYMLSVVTGTTSMKEITFVSPAGVVLAYPIRTSVVTTIPTTIPTMVQMTIKTPVPTMIPTTISTTIPTAIPTVMINYSATIAEMQKQIADLKTKNKEPGNWIDFWQKKEFCGDKALGMDYIEHIYLWGNDGFMTKRYDISSYLEGQESVKTDMTKFEFDTKRKAHCSV